MQSEQVRTRNNRRTEGECGWHEALDRVRGVVKGHLPANYFRVEEQRLKQAVR
jgi:hypothetical protein